MRISAPESRTARYWTLTIILLTALSSAQEVPGKPEANSALQIAELEKRAQAGDANAQFALGQAYDFGNGIPQNEQQACLWYRKSAEQGYPPAQNSLGLMYRSGRGVEPNKEQAVSWYRKAAKQGNAKAMFNLGTAYYNGDGVTTDDSAAYAWFLLAREAGSDPAREALNRMEGSLKSWQLSAALESVGDFYEQGNDLPQDRKRAIEWYRKAALLGEPTVCVKLAKDLIDSGEPQAYPEALERCEQAGKQMYSPGAVCAGLLYQRGLGTSQDLEHAAKWFTRAAELGNAQGMLQLGQMYWSGSGVKQNKISAYAFMLLASTANLPDALRDKSSYEQALSSKELEKARKQADAWARQHPVTRIILPPSR